MIFVFGGLLISCDAGASCAARDDDLGSAPPAARSSAQRDRGYSKVETRPRAPGAARVTVAT